MGSVSNNGRAGQARTTRPPGSTDAATPSRAVDATNNKPEKADQAPELLPPLPVAPSRPPVPAPPPPAGQGQPPLQGLPSPLRLSKRRLSLAFAIAGISDLLSVWLAFAPPIEWGLDFTTALLLFAVLGWQWLLLPGLIMEAIPGVYVFPFWVLVVGAIAVWGTARPKGDGPQIPR